MYTTGLTDWESVNMNLTYNYSENVILNYHKKPDILNSDILSSAHRTLLRTLTQFRFR